MLRVHPYTPERRLIARVIVERRESWVDAEKDARANVLVDHPLNVV
jgi:hypothetical protein